MKILHLITSLKIGGAESALINFLRVANNNPHEHVVCYFHPGPNVAKLKQLGVKVYRLKGIISYIDPLALCRLIKFIKHIKPDVIHSALWSANIIGRLVAWWLKLPIICDIHGNSFDEGMLRNWFDRVTVGYATCIVAVSQTAADAYTTNILAPQKKANLNIIKNGIDYQMVRAAAQQCPRSRATFGLADTDFVIGAVGRLEPIKSYDLLIRAFAQCRFTPRKLVIVGGGSQEAQLKQLTRTLNITNTVVFVGAHADAISFFPLFDCFVLSSQSEGLSISLLEALCFGLPIVTTHQTKHHDVIAHGINGLLVPTNDINALAHAITTIAENSSLRSIVQKNNTVLIETSYSLATTIKTYHTLYAQVQRKTTNHKYHL